MYDSLALDAAWQIVQDWTEGERQEMRNSVPLTALDTPFRNRTVRDIAAEVVALAKAGLVRRANQNREGEDESIYLAPVEETLASGKTPADRLLDEYENAWHGDIEKIFTTHAY
jgi:glutamate--cysteine ligase